MIQLKSGITFLRMLKYQCEVITDKTEIEEYIIQRNQIYINQAQCTTHTIPLMSTLLGEDSFTPSENRFGTVSRYRGLPISEIQKQFFLSLKKKISKTIKNNITVAYMNKD